MVPKEVNSEPKVDSENVVTKLPIDVNLSLLYYA
jgi:hypothetical protein